MKFQLLYPEKRIINDDTLIAWAKDVLASDEADPLYEGTEISSVWDAIAILDPDHITLGNFGNPVA